VVLLLHAKIDVSLRNYEDYTALHIAFWNRNKEIQRLIMDAGGLLQIESTFAYYEPEPEPEPDVNINEVTDIADMAKFFAKR
jgi:ankyrin repeat protein